MKTTRYAIAAIALACMIAAPGARAANGSETELSIDAGRLDAMMMKSEEMLHLTSADSQLPQSTGFEQAFAALKDAVSRYRRIAPVACSTHAVGTALCADYSPAWLGDTTVPQADELRRRIDEATGHIAPLWDALCAPRKEAGDAEVCQIE